MSVIFESRSKVIKVTALDIYPGRFIQKASLPAVLWASRAMQQNCRSDSELDIKLSQHYLLLREVAVFYKGGSVFRPQSFEKNINK